MAVQGGRIMRGLVASAAVAALIVVVIASEGYKAAELEETELYIVPQANVLTGSGQRPATSGSTPSVVATSQKKATTQKLSASPHSPSSGGLSHRGRSGSDSKSTATTGSKVAQQKHKAHRWTSIQQKVAEQVKRAMEKQQAEQDAAAKKAASAAYWSTVKHSIFSEKHKEKRLQGTRELERAMAAEQEADTQDEDYDRVMAEHRQLQERKSEIAQESEEAGEKAFKDLSTRDSGMEHAHLYHVSETHCGRACQIARNIVT